MKLFIDTADVAQIKEAWSWGIIDGVTTNPTHVMKTGRKPEEVYREILAIVNGPVSLETVSLDAPAIISEGKALAKLGPNDVVKMLYDHPLTDIGLDIFLKDWAKATGQSK